MARDFKTTKIDGTPSTVPGAVAVESPSVSGTNIEDSFTAANGTLLNARLPDVVDNGAVWSGTNADIQGNELRITANLGGGNIQLTTPDQSVKIQFNAGGVDNRMGLSIRRDANASPLPTDGYLFNFRTGANELALLRYNGGSNVTLTSTPFTINQSQNYELLATVTTQGGNPVITCYVDDVLRIGPYTDTAANKILTGNYCGVIHFIHTNDSARFDDFTASEFGASQLIVSELLHAHEMPVVNVTKQLTVSVLDNPDSTEIGTWETVT